MYLTVSWRYQYSFLIYINKVLRKRLTVSTEQKHPESNNHSGNIKLKAVQTHTSARNVFRVRPSQPMWKLKVCSEVKVASCCERNSSLHTHFFTWMRVFVWKKAGFCLFRYMRNKVLRQQIKQKSNKNEWHVFVRKTTTYILIRRQ